MAGKPKPTAIARTVAAVAAIAGVAVALPFVAQVIPYYTLRLADGQDRAALLALLLVLALGAFLIYRNTIRVMMLMPWSRGDRLGPRAQVPAELVPACLRGVDFECPGCRYNLRDLDRPTCPECSRPVRLAFTDAASRPMAVGFFLTFWWLMLTLAVNVVTAYATGRIVVQILTSPWGGAGGFSSPYSWYYLFYGVGLLIDFASICACLARLWSLREVGPESGARWTHTTVVTLITLNIIGLFAGGCQAVLSIMFL